MPREGACETASVDHRWSDLSIFEKAYVVATLALGVITIFIAWHWSRSE